MNVHCHNHFHDQRANRRDPTRSNDMRSRMDTIMRKAVQQWKRAIEKTLVKDDMLALTGISAIAWTHSDRLDKFDGFARSAMVQVFMQPKEELRKIVAAVYTRGQRHAYSERNSPGPPMSPPIPSLYTKLLYGEINTILEATMQLMHRTVATGAITGQTGRSIFGQISQITRKITLNRLYTAGHTNVTQVYNAGKLEAYKKMDVEKVGIIAEHIKVQSTKDAYRRTLVAFTTAQDDRVCPSCEDLEGRVYPLAEAFGVIPVHPNCRCTFEIVDENDRLIEEKGILSVLPGEE